MFFTKLALGLGALFLAFLIWLALMGVPVVGEGLITVFVLFALVAGGNLLSGRGRGRSRRAASELEPRPLRPAPSPPEAGGDGAEDPGA